TTTCQPCFSFSFFAIRQAVVSLPPPGTNGTMMWIGLLGKFAAGSGCARLALPAKVRTAAATTARRLNDPDGRMLSPSWEIPRHAKAHSPPRRPVVTLSLLLKSAETPAPVGAIRCTHRA